MVTGSPTSSILIDAPLVVISIQKTEINEIIDSSFQLRQSLIPIVEAAENIVIRMPKQLYRNRQNNYTSDISTKLRHLTPTILD
jgi:hypothetical protein